MTALPIADWQTSLAAMDAALADTLAALDRYETEWDRTLGAAEPPPPADVWPARIDARLAEWDARLVAATELAASVEAELAEQEEAVGRWRTAFERWREVIQQG